MLPIAKKSALALIAIGLVGSGIASAYAETAWQEHHPRRAQVNHRLARQNARIHHEVKEGELTPQQAGQLHAQDHAIRQEERAMAAEHGGHITAQEQRTLNQQENAVSREIGH